jgi:hypothetical protein
MKTTYNSGAPCDLEDLLNVFFYRVKNLSSIADQFLSFEPELDARGEILARGVGQLREDWEDFEEAVRPWDARENGTGYAEDLQKARGAAARR